MDFECPEIPDEEIGDINQVKLSRNPIKKRSPVVDARLGSELSIDAPNSLMTEKPLSIQDFEFISQALNRNFIFTSLHEEHQSLLISRMKHYSLAPYEIVFEQSHPGLNFFIVASGRLEVLVNMQRVNLIQKGDTFGELALLHDSPRSATVKTVEYTTL